MKGTQLSCETYRAIRQVLGVRRKFFNDLQALTRYLYFESWHQPMEASFSEFRTRSESIFLRQVASIPFHLIMDLLCILNYNNCQIPILRTHMILIENAAILTMNPAGDIHWPGWVLLAGDRISAVGTGEPTDAVRVQAERVIDATHMAVLPGLVNAHTHLAQTFMRGLGDDKSLLTWLKQVMWPLQAVMTAEDMRLASLLGLVENLKCGATAVNQHHKLPDPAIADATLQAAETVGLRFQLARSWVDLGESGERSDAIIAELERLHRQWQGAGDGRITISNGPMAPWRCSDETMLKTVALARSWGAPTHIHVAEAQDEINLMLDRNGLRHIEWLASLNALGPDMQLVHCVHVSEAEIDLIAESGSTVVHCPTSNMYLASGIAPVPTILQREIPVALGTDGSASHNSQDLLETMKTAILLAKVGSGDPTALVPADILCMATTDGARIMNRSDVGQLSPGYKADITLVDLNKPHIMPVHRPDSALVYNCNGPDIHTVIVDGDILLDAGRVTMLDELELLEECREAARDVDEAGGNLKAEIRGRRTEVGNQKSDATRNHATRKNHSTSLAPYPIRMNLNEPNYPNHWRSATRRTSHRPDLG